MNISGTRRDALAARAAAVALVAALAAAPTLAAEDDDEGGLHARVEATLGWRLYIIDSPYDNNSLGGFWDQYQHTNNKNNEPPFFIDLFHLDVGLARDDDTYLVRLERWSPNHTNDRIEVDANYRGLGFDLDYRRYRSEALRFFPRGTYQPPEIPPGFLTYGTQYTPDASIGEVLSQNERFWLKRTGVDGELRFRPEGFGFDLPVLSQASLRAGYEQRKGWRQDSFLLEPGLALESLRFRGNRRRVDQEVSNVGGGVVLTPGGGWVMDFDVFFESFREKANVVTLQDLADDDPNLCPLGPCPPSLAAFNFTPNTDRLSGSLRVAGKLGPVSLHGGAFLTSLRQTNTGPLGLDKQDLMTWSGHAGFDTPLGERADVSGFVKFSQRRNGLDANDLAVNSYIAPLLRRRSELEAQVELAARPLAGSLVATGYRFDRVDRNFRYPDPTADPTAPPAVLDPSLSLVENDSERHTVYLRGRARLLRRVQVSGELGWQYAPQRDFPRDATSTIYFDGRGSTTLPRPFPVTLSVYGSVRDGQGNGIVLTGQDTQARKDFDRLQWNYGATLAAIPGSRTTITLSFIENRDEQDFPYLRTDNPRTFGSSFSNLLPNPERPHYKSDVKSLSLGCAQKLTDSLDGRAFTNVHWVRAWFSDSSQTSTALEDANEIKSTILSLGGGLGWKALPGLRLDLGYRFDHYLDHRDQREPIGQNDERHTFTLAATVDIGLFTGTLRSSQASSD